MKKFKVFFKYVGYLGLILLPIALLAFLTELLTQPGSLLTPWFWFSVLINMFPITFVVFIVWGLAGRFTQRVYELDSLGQAVKFLRRRRFGKMGFSPFMTLSQGKVARDAHGLLARGGPATLIIYTDTAVVLEKCGRLTRVEGPGFPLLEPFEKIYNIIDLRPKCWELTVNAMTREGIPITWEVEVQYQINDGGQEPTDKKPYPFLKEDVFRAATCNWRRERGRVQDIDWEGWVVVSQTEGTLRSILGLHCLDELIGLTEADQLAIRESIQKELEEAIHQVAPKVGAKILEIKLDNLKVEDGVTQQWIDNWRVRWHNWSIKKLAEEEAESIKAFEMAEAEARLLPLNLLAKELEELESGQDIMRFLSALAQARLDRELFLSGDARDVLRMLGGGIMERQQQLPELESASSMPQMRGLPLISEIAAGEETPTAAGILGGIHQTGEFEFELGGQSLEVKKILKGSQLDFAEEYGYVAMPVLEDSMNRAGISPGDYVILQTSKLVEVSPISGDIVAVSFRNQDDKNQVTFKRIYIEENGVVLQPESSNPKYEPRVVQQQDFAGDNPAVIVVGIALAVLNRKRDT
jgi:SOS-response transcriptional repressor LexA